MNKTEAETAITFNRRLGRFEGLTEAQLDEWAQVFHRVQVDAEIRRAEAWAACNPCNMQRSWDQFLIGWLQAQQRKNDQDARHKASAERQAGATISMQAGGASLSEFINRAIRETAADEMAKLHRARGWLVYFSPAWWRLRRLAKVLA